MHGDVNSMHDPQQTPQTEKNDNFGHLQLLFEIQLDHQRESNNHCVLHIHMTRADGRVYPKEKKKKRAHRHVKWLLEPAAKVRKYQEHRLQSKEEQNTYTYPAENLHQCVSSVGKVNAKAQNF